jgi:tetratricopeptide (TPR) repeat protein
LVDPADHLRVRFYAYPRRHSWRLEVGKPILYFFVAFEFICGQSNILVGEHPNIRLADFGTATVLFNSPTPTLSVTKDGAGTIRFMAPELHAEPAPDADGPKMSFATDIYAFTITLWEVILRASSHAALVDIFAGQLFTGQVPFANIRGDYAIVLHVHLGRRPFKPTTSVEVGFTDDVWDVMQRGWAPDPLDRPTLAEFWKAIAPAEITLQQHQVLAMHRQALDLLSPGHLDRSISLDSLADALWDRSERLGDLDSIADMIDLRRQALTLCPPGNPARSVSLEKLAVALQTGFEQLGKVALLLEAVELHRQALDLRPLGHPDRSDTLRSLANALRIRFERLSDLESLVEAIDLLRQALKLCPPGHPDRSRSLNDLGTALQARFGQLGEIDLLTEAVDLHRQALDLRPPGHPHRSDTLSNLADTLNTRYGQLGEADSLSEAVDLLQQAWALRLTQ